jgi:hypothetical protein
MNWVALGTLSGMPLEDLSDDPEIAALVEVSDP